MRRRKVKGADERLLSYKNYVVRDNIEDLKGNWNKLFKNDNPIYAEFGTGRGKFITTLAKQNPDINFIAFEIKEEVLLKAVEKADMDNLNNIVFAWANVGNALDYFDSNELSRIYINFCDPWPKTRWAKRRLTHSNFLNIYKEILNEKGEIHFTRNMDQKDLKEVLKIIDYYHLHHEIITQNGSYSSNSSKEQLEAYMRIFRDINPEISHKELKEYVVNHMENFKINQVKDLNFLTNDINTQVLKILFNSPENPEIFTEVEKEINKQTENLIITSASNFNLEINHKEANKGKAVADFAKMRNYQPNEFINIGDNINDLTMLEWADHSYAVANAHERAKEIASYQAPSHTNDAVAQIIEKVLNGDNLSF